MEIEDTRKSKADKPKKVEPTKPPTNVKERGESPGMSQLTCNEMALMAMYA